MKRRAVKTAPVMVVAATAGLAGVLVSHTVTASSRLLPSGNTSSSTGSSSHGSGPTSPKTGSSGASGASGTPVSGTAAGALEQYGYGEVAVKVTVQSGRIVSLAVSQLRTADTYSQQIANQVIPMLRSEVLSAQSARINGISGATYTSEGYAMSIQSALDKLHFK